MILLVLRVLCVFRFSVLNLLYSLSLLVFLHFLFFASMYFIHASPVCNSGYRVFHVTNHIHDYPYRGCEIVSFQPPVFPALPDFIVLMYSFHASIVRNPESRSHISTLPLTPQFHHPYQSKKKFSHSIA